MKIPPLKTDVAQLARLDGIELDGLSQSSTITAPTKAGTAPTAGPSDFRQAVSDVAAAYRSGEIATPGEAIDAIVKRYVDLRFSGGPVPEALRDHLKVAISTQLSGDPLFVSLFKRSV
ncbi:MAG: hypothetical protein KC609_04925 [Myxococcales bacterium]|nr:hypothetical protein [Myxococcales bacterium]